MCSIALSDPCSSAAVGDVGCGRRRTCTARVIGDIKPKFVFLHSFVPLLACLFVRVYVRRVCAYMCVRTCACVLVCLPACNHVMLFLYRPGQAFLRKHVECFNRIICYSSTAATCRLPLVSSPVLFCTHIAPNVARHYLQFRCLAAF